MLSVNELMPYVDCDHVVVVYNPTLEEVLEIDDGMFDYDQFAVKYVYAEVDRVVIEIDACELTDEDMFKIVEAQ